MKTTRQGGIRLTAFFMTFCMLLAALAVSAGAQSTSTDVLIRLKPGALIAPILASFPVKLVDEVPDANIFQLTILPPNEPERIAGKIRNDKSVLWVAFDEEVDVPELHDSQIHVAFDAGPKAGAYDNQFAYAQIRMNRIGNAATGSGVTVAILDTGIDINHPVFAGRLVQGYNAFDHNLLPLDKPEGNTNAALGHGTMVSGLITKMAPGSLIMPVKVLNSDGLGSVFNVIKGLYFAQVHGARVVNMSFGTPIDSDALKDAIEDVQKKGVTMIASTGNEGANVKRYPAAYQKVIAVTAVENDDKKSSYANFGSYVWLSAPGTNLRSTYWNDGYATWSGTSFAAPLVTGTAALTLSRKPTLKMEELVARLGKMARFVGPANPGMNGKIGKGVVDTERSVLTKF